MTSTLEQCFGRSPESCSADSRCTLEYDVSRENPTCVPKLQAFQPRHMSDADLSIINSIVKRLLPGSLQGNDAMLRDRGAFERELENLTEELRPKIAWRIQHTLRRSEYTSWAELVQRVARDVIDDLREYTHDRTMCPTCISSVKGGSNDLTVHPCCGAVFHTECSQRWKNGRECPMCRVRVPTLQTVSSSVDRTRARALLVTESYDQFGEFVEHVLLNPPQPHDFTDVLEAITSMINEEDLPQLQADIAHRLVRIAAMERETAALRADSDRLNERYEENLRLENLRFEESLRLHKMIERWVLAIVVALLLLSMQ